VLNEHKIKCLFKKQKTDIAVKFNETKVKSGVIKELNSMVLHKRSNKTKIKKVQKNCRRLIFTRWRYLVGAAIPQTLIAVQFHLRTFFTAFLKVTVSRRGVIRQRKLI
jgi:hypothetical protein